MLICIDFYDRRGDLRPEMEGTVLNPSLDGMKHVRTKEGEMLTKPFIDVCKLILPILGVSESHSFTFPTFFKKHILFHNPRSYDLLLLILLPCQIRISLHFHKF